MGVAGLIFEPHPPNFQNQYNFWRFSNDVKMIVVLTKFIKFWQTMMKSVFQVFL